MEVIKDGIILGNVFDMAPSVTNALANPKVNEFAFQSVSSLQHRLLALDFPLSQCLPFNESFKISFSSSISVYIEDVLYPV